VSLFTLVIRAQYFIGGSYQGCNEPFVLFKYFWVAVDFLPVEVEAPRETLWESKYWVLNSSIKVLIPKRTRRSSSLILPVLSNLKHT